MSNPLEEFYNDVVSEVHVKIIRERNGLVAIASAVIKTAKGNFFINSIGLYTKRTGGYRLTYPTKKSGNSELQLFNPLHVDLHKELEDKIIKEYEDLLVSEI
jgi:DNA-binding cell septation regulator SpoVG